MSEKRLVAEGETASINSVRQTKTLPAGGPRWARAKGVERSGRPSHGGEGEAGRWWPAQGHGEGNCAKARPSPRLSLIGILTHGSLCGLADATGRASHAPTPKSRSKSGTRLSCDRTWRIGRSALDPDIRESILEPVRRPSSPVNCVYLTGVVSPKQ